MTIIKTKYFLASVCKVFLGAKVGWWYCQGRLGFLCKRLMAWLYDKSEKVSVTRRKSKSPGWLAIDPLSSFLSLRGKLIHCGNFKFSHWLSCNITRSLNIDSVSVLIWRFAVTCARHLHSYYLVYLMLVHRIYIIPPISDRPYQITPFLWISEKISPLFHTLTDILEIVIL